VLNIKPNDNMNAELTDDVGKVYLRLNQLVSIINNLPDRYSAIANLLRRECRGVLLDTSLWLSITNRGDRDQINNRIGNQLSAMLQVVNNSIKQADLTPNGRELLLKLRGVLSELISISNKV
jgi:hypothetical protein